VALFVLTFIVVVAIVEIVTAVEVSYAIGVAWTIVALVAVSLLGARLVRHQGLVVWRRVGQQLAAGRVPAAELLDGLVLLVAGTLLVIPGFVTGAVGAIACLPPVRKVEAGWLRRRYGRRVTVIHATSTGPLGPVIDVDGDEGSPPGRQELGR
jgi:UPF0716 protein FxsA